MLDCGSPRITKMVERPPFCLERESNFTKPSSIDNRDRCLHNGLGSILWKFPDQRPLVSFRTAITHKLFRTLSRRVCPEVISKKQVQYPYKANDGQYNSNKLSYKQSGWANIIGPVKPSLRPLAMVSRTIYNSRSAPFARAVKHSGRFRIPGPSRHQRLATGSVHIFQGINNKWGPFPVDLFASRLTAQLIRFVSWKPDPEAEAVDAFTLDWNQLRGFAFPPFALIGRCLRQVLRQSVSQLTIVTPVWETQPWHPLLLEMTIDNPILLPSFPGLLRHENNLHPLAHLQLAAWLVSGVDIKVQQFHSQLKDCSWLHEEPGQKQLILQHGESGLVGVVNNKSISFQHL